MLKIGITGGIGSGKTTVCRVFEVLGIPVFYADTVAKQIMVQDQILISGIKDTFGEESYSSEGLLNNKHIAGIVFNDTLALEKLNALVHPAVFRAFDQWVAQVPASSPYILKEAALLFESGSYQMCDYSILVTAPLAVRKERVMLRDQVTEEQVQARIDKQFTDEKKLELADFTLENNESTSIIMQVLDLHLQFINRKN
ncbi:dephospho-CoA kinase [Pedobacter sp.]|uniref:dephospho-CoA kinase n=1 Tax=Pedobacter sp. TaxID=1411316 RepID=UPI003D7FB5BA